MEFEDDRGGWTDDMNRGGDDPGGDDTMENPQEVLNQCLEKFKTNDYIMEPGIFTQLKRQVLQLLVIAVVSDFFCYSS